MKIIDTKPELFKKTENSIWTDPYIQANLLSAHLDISSDAASRNMSSIETTVDYIDKNIQRNSQLLDLGCGPGLYAERLAHKGHIVRGIDLNRKAIEYARIQNKEIEYIEGDYIKSFPSGKYDAIIMIYCDMGTHSDCDRDKLLSNCYQSLNDGGKLIFDVFNKNITSDKVEGNTWEYCDKAGFWANEEYLILKQTFHYQENHAFAYQYNLIAEDKYQHFIIWERYYTEEEIGLILEKVGFKNIKINPNLLLNNNFTSNSEMFIIAEK